MRQLLTFHPDPRPWHMVVAVLICFAVAMICLPLLRHLDPANIVMLFLLAVAVVATLFGRKPALVSAVLSIALFDFLFVEPRFSFAVRDSQYLVTFAVMLIVGWLISELSSVLRQQLSAAQQREQQMRALYECAHALAGALDISRVCSALQACLLQCRGGQITALFMPDATENLQRHSLPETFPSRLSLPDKLLANSVFHSGNLQSITDEQDANQQHVYLPLRGATRLRGVLVVSAPATSAETQYALLQALAALAATTLERLHFVDVAQTHAIQMQAERLRSSILSALSHDIRTPLTVLCGLADTLKLTHADLPPSALTLLDDLRTQSARLHGMVDNLLDMARLQSGGVHLRQEWQPLEEVIGSSVRALGDTLHNHLLQIELAPDLPLINIDALLMERVFCNLLENAEKYSPAATPIRLRAAVEDRQLHVSIHNAGSSFREPTAPLFDVFQRGNAPTATPGFGLGLAICRSIIEAHGGTIRADNDSEGACVSFTLPLGTPPTIEQEPLQELPA